MKKLACILGLGLSVSGLSVALADALDLENPANNKTENLVWVGHLSPDTDTVGSAIIASYLYGGKPTVPADISPETSFVLEYCQVEQPEIVTDYASYDVGLVDFNQKTQLAPTINPESIRAIIDHHALGGDPITAPQLISMDIRSWGSAATILSDRAEALGQELTPEMACVALGALLSDTVILTSATTTDYDRHYAEKLATIAGIKDIQAFGDEMLLAKSDLSHMSEAEILVLDYKNFEYAGKNVGIGVSETLRPNDLIDRKAGFIEAMEAYKSDNHLDYLFFSVMDIENQRSIFFILGNDEQAVLESAFGADINDGMMVAEGVVSRKKQIGPSIQKVLESQ